MTGSSAAKTILGIIGKTQSELADCLDTSKQALNNKFQRDTWTLKDLLKISRIAKCKLLFRFDDGTEIVLTEPPEN